MNKYRIRQSFRFGISLTCVLVAGVSLSACYGVDKLFDDDNGSQATDAVDSSPRAQVRAASLRCDGIADERTWLLCYYGAAQSVRAELRLPPAPVAQQKLVPPPP